MPRDLFVNITESKNMKMKKIAILFAAAVSVMAMSSCKQNTAPRFTPATKFVVNTPALASQYYDLATPEGTIDLDWSQPDWGFSAAGQYVVQMSLNENFKATEIDGQTYDDYFELPDVFKTCNASISMENVAIGLCKLRGISKEEQYTDEPARPVYFRVIGSVPGIEGSEILSSNVVCLQKVKGYCAIQSPGKIYLVGAPAGWKGPDAANAEHYASWALYEPEDAIGSQQYSGTFQVEAGNAMFRFYTALTGWDADSWGSQADDNPIEFELNDNEFSYTLVKGKGAFSFPAWQGGTMEMHIDMNTHEFTIKATPAN